jgi:hypothetical protein
MGKFMGGSAYAAARDIAEGFLNVTERTFKKLSAAEMNALGHEVDRYLRELRGEAISAEDTVALQTRNRRIQRLNSANVVLRNCRTARR